MLLKDKVGLVTGGGDGIGRATAQMFARDGARVAVADIRLGAAEETVELIRAEGGDALALETDVSSESAVAQMVDAVISHYGRLDCACNNAAGGGGFNRVPDVTEESWDRCQSITLKGVWLSMKYEIPAMLSSGGGAIVNIASLSGVRGEALQSPYSAAKGGVIALTRTAAAEYAQQGIRVNAINPGAILTRALANYIDTVPGAREHTVGTHAMRRFGQPEEIADAVVYLCSERSSFVTGHSLNVDGGVMVNPHTL
ncbi:glucose 1-dehydrogenase [Halieaceae bacterium IMCC14734]|uniref:Glucose 1-dehydrogenase n=1 Tax=Candidatus Litorirhabdus singularis TaxID=2518993 RepID=A0ABT3TAK1_9GAMM|nr:glucose 1-dehydrogenase [Candidatus Litorirhabdus singularis]MCX2979301.1 glucose 1-dehydrogenase [Candidatus Litorirhabdus singularis]